MSIIGISKSAGNHRLIISHVWRAATSPRRSLRTGKASFSRWECYVRLTVFLHQKGSPESKKLKGEEPVDADPRRSRQNKNSPWLVRRGGLLLKLYENSLSLALFSLFLLSFAVHAARGVKEYNQEQAEHGAQPVSVVTYLGTSRFWFESFQNWQREFLSIGDVDRVVLFLGQKGSPQSKPVDHLHGDTGGVTS
jgi:Domain of unknown function (DUF6766)